MLWVIAQNGGREASIVPYEPNRRETARRIHWFHNMYSPRYMPGIPYSMVKGSKSNKSGLVAAQNKSNRSRDVVVKNAPVSKGVTTRSMPVNFGVGGKLRITHRELVGTATNGATVSQFKVDPQFSSYPGIGDVNPGNFAAFPWLSNIAHNFEKWHFSALRFELVSRMSTATAGVVYASFDYDYNDPSPLNQVSMMANMHAKSFPVWDGATIVVDCKRMHQDLQWRYVDIVGRTTTVDPRLVWGGYLTVAYNTPTANCLHDLWVEYTVELDLPAYEIEAPDWYKDSGAVSTAAVTAVLGATVHGRLFSFPQSGTTGVKVVTAGSTNGPPAVTFDTSGTTANWPMLDMSSTFFRGVFEAAMNSAIPGITPDEMEDINCGMNALVYDGKGAYVGACSFTDGQSLQSHGPVVGATHDVAGSTYRSLFTVDLSLIRKAFNTAMYLVLMYYGGAATDVAGTVQQYWRIAGMV